MKGGEWGVKEDQLLRKQGEKAIFASETSALVFAVLQAEQAEK